jgi:hypothetical protein
MLTGCNSDVASPYYPNLDVRELPLENTLSLRITTSVCYPIAVSSRIVRGLLTWASTNATATDTGAAYELLRADGRTTRFWPAGDSAEVDFQLQRGRGLRLCRGEPHLVHNFAWRAE